MKQSIVKFLEFKGKSLLFLSKDGIYWIALKPICEALNVNYQQQHKNILADLILGPASCNHTIQIPNDQARIMTCLPEYLIYGYIFSIRSDSPELLEYKKECYKVLFDYFHGTITSRQNLIKEKAQLQTERISLENDLRQDNRFVRYEEVKAGEARIGKGLKRLDNEEINQQLSLFN